MKNPLVIVLVGILILFSLGFIIDALNLAHFRFFEPAREQVRRETYEQTKSFRDGSVQRLGTLCDQIADTNTGDNHRSLLRQMVKHEFATFNASDFPEHLRPCLTEARRVG